MNFVTVVGMAAVVVDCNTVVLVVLGVALVLFDEILVWTDSNYYCTCLEVAFGVMAF